MLKDTIETWKELPAETKFYIKSTSVAYGMGALTASLFVALF